jgi:septal ring factor EnvC (AmiA/AmiB activator)
MLIMTVSFLRVQNLLAEKEDILLAAERQREQYQSGPCGEMQVRLTAAEQKYEREKRESGDSLAKLERALTQARSEAAEWRREASAAEAERDKLQASLHRSRASPASPPPRSAVATRRGGDRTARPHLAIPPVLGGLLRRPGWPVLFF